MIRAALSLFAYLLSVCAFAAPTAAQHVREEKGDRSSVSERKKHFSRTLPHDTAVTSGVFGPTVCVDPQFAYYSHQSLAETMEKIRAAGFTAVQVIDTGRLSPETHRKWAECAHSLGLAAVLRIYPPTDLEIYESHPEWRQRMLGGAEGRFDWRVYVCPREPAALDALCDKLATTLQAASYDGVQLAECWFEQWGGPEIAPGQPRPHYACVCERCLQAFRDQTGLDAREMLTNPASPYYWRRAGVGADAYAVWVQQRVDAVSSMTLRLVQAARRVSPRIVVNLMVLSDATVEPGKTREYQGVDWQALLTSVQPEILTIQDAWQDWTRADLPPTFIREYGKAYCGTAKRLLPQVFLMTHADVGSLPASRRSSSWVAEFQQESIRSGFDAASFYEWSIGPWGRR